MQHGKWETSDNVPILEVEWTRRSKKSSFSTVLAESTYCPHCEASSSYPGIKDGGEHFLKSSLGCTALKVSEDLSELYIVAINCSAKYWSDILCLSARVLDLKLYKKQILSTNIKDSLPMRGNLPQHEKTCPKYFPIYFEEQCLKFQLLPSFTGSPSRLNLLTPLLNPYVQPKFDNSLQGIYRSYASIIKIFKSRRGDRNFALLFKSRMKNVNNMFYVYAFENHQNDETGIIELLRMVNPLTSYMENYLDIVKPFFSTSLHYVVCTTSDMYAIYPFQGHHVAGTNCNVMFPFVICDGRIHCPNGEDEVNCPPGIQPSKAEACKFPECMCSNLYFQCDKGGCIPYDHLCDGLADCTDGEDEVQCHHIRRFAQDYKTVSNDSISCASGNGYFDDESICWYDTNSTGSLIPCSDGSHLASGLTCRYVMCHGGYKCLLSYCLPVRKVCDGVVDCVNGEDEENCAEFTCPGFLRCYNSKTCISEDEVCDGVANCPHADDERYCQSCPHQCECHGTSISCSNIQFRQPSYHPLQPASAIILTNSSSLLSTMLERHSNRFLQMLFLKQGNLSSDIFSDEMFSDLPSVRVVHLVYQNLTYLPSIFIQAPNMKFLNLSHNKISILQSHCFIETPRISILILQNNLISSLSFSSFHNLKFLSYLLLQSNPIVQVSEATFSNNPYLALVQSENYKICCAAQSVRKCEPSTYFTSTCFNLISSLLHKYLIIFQAAISTVSNLVVFIMHYSSKVPKQEQIMITSVAVAGFLMGVYLCGIVTLDMYHHGTFFTLLQTWNFNVICGFLGFLHFVSSELSLLLTLVFYFISAIDSISNGYHTMRICRYLKLKVMTIYVLCIIAGSLIFIHNLHYSLIGLQTPFCIYYNVLPASSNLELIFSATVIGVDYLCIVLIFVFFCLVLFFSNFKQVKRSDLSSSSNPVNTMKTQNPKSISTSKQSGGSNVETSDHESKALMLRLKSVWFFILFIGTVACWLPQLVLSTTALSHAEVNEDHVVWFAVLLLPLIATLNTAIVNIIIRIKCR